MDCNAKLYHHGRRKYKTGIAGDLHWFHINNEKIYGDLINLGLSPKKSKTVEFPNIAKEFVRHFIRGCWDGDGSIFFSQNNLEASYVSGSKNFVERLVQELNKIGISRSNLSYRTEKGGKRILLPITDVMRSDYPDGKFPLVIHEDKRSNAYYIKIRTRENVDKLFHFFYDGVDESMYLSRKYDVFVKGLNLARKEETEQLIPDLNF